MFSEWSIINSGEKKISLFLHHSIIFIHFKLFPKASKKIKQKKFQQLKKVHMNIIQQFTIIVSYQSLSDFCHRSMSFFTFLSTSTKSQELLIEKSFK